MFSTGEPTEPSTISSGTGLFIMTSGIRSPWRQPLRAIPQRCSSPNLTGHLCLISGPIERAFAGSTTKLGFTGADSLVCLLPTPQREMPGAALIAEHNLVLTTYGTMLRDVTQLSEIEFDYI